MTLIRAACVGAGARAYSAHHPCLAHLAVEVTIPAVCDLDAGRLARGGDFVRLRAGERYTGTRPRK
jgi:predicted dehydrogenase